MASSGSTSYSIRGHSVVFYEGPHEYYVDGVKVPSVTELLERYSRLHGLDDYSNIPQDVLRRAAARGTALHNEIEQFEKFGTRGSSEEFWNYLTLKSRYGVRVESSELPVIIFDESGKPVCAGRLDLIASLNGQTAVGDIKRTSRLYPEKVSLQINLYRIGYMQSYGKSIDRLFVMRLRKSVSQFVEFPIDEKAAWAVLRECNNSSTETNRLQNGRYNTSQAGTVSAQTFKGTAGKASKSVNGRASVQGNFGVRQSRPAYQPNQGVVGSFDNSSQNQNVAKSSITPAPKYYSSEEYTLLSPTGWYTLKGRMCRGELWMRLTIWSWLLYKFDSLFSKHEPSDALFFIVVVLLVFFPIFSSIWSRRFHDLDRNALGSAFNVLMFLIFPFLAFLYSLSSFVRYLIELGLREAIDSLFHGGVSSANELVFTIVLICIWFIGITAVPMTAGVSIAACFVKGTDGKNRYGPY